MWSVRVFKSRLEDHGLELVVVEAIITLCVHGVAESLNDIVVGDAQVVVDLRAAKLAARFDQVLNLDLRLLLEVQVLEESLHFLKVAAIHEDGTDSAQKFIEVDVLLLSLVEQVEDALEDLRWVLETEHLHNFDEVETLDAARTMVLLQ